MKHYKLQVYNISLLQYVDRYCRSIFSELIYRFNAQPAQLWTILPFKGITGGKSLNNKDMKQKKGSDNLFIK